MLFDLAGRVSSAERHGDVARSIWDDGIVRWRKPVAFGMEIIKRMERKSSGHRSGSRV